MTTIPSDTAPRRAIVLVCLDLDGTSDWALLEGARVARERGFAELHVVYVIEPKGQALDALDKRLVDAPAALRRRIEELWAGTEPLQVIAHIGVGDPANLILQTANDLEADVVVVGSHQRGALSKVVLGSVADQVLRGSHCSVLVALPRDYSHVDKPRHVAPLCPDCVDARMRSEGASYWCARHQKSYVTPHVYTPRDGVSRRARTSSPGIL